MLLNDMLRRYGREEMERLYDLPHYRAKQIYKALHAERLTLFEMILELRELNEKNAKERLQWHGGENSG